MVEGHSVHRIASRFRSHLVGRRFAASSPNGRFLEGSGAIDGLVMSNIEAVGKNLFAFFSPTAVDAAVVGGASTNNDSTNGRLLWDDSLVVVHVHFGMSGAWSVHTADQEPEVKPTTRLRLVAEPDQQHTTLVAHLSAMTCQHGTYDLYAAKRAALGHDPLRSDADPDELYRRVRKSKKSIGKLIMDQSYFTGPGNIYRAEILFLAGIHPETLGNALDRPSFDRVWEATVGLLRRGYDTGSILTVDASVDPDVAARGERRYIYNRSRCARCDGPVRSWDMAGRTCYACDGGCQPRLLDDGASGVDMDTSSSKSSKSTATNPKKKSKKTQKKKSVAAKAEKKSSSPAQHVPFVSSCARDGLEKRLSRHGPAGLTVTEIRAQILKVGGEETVLPKKSARKAAHVEALAALLAGAKREEGAKQVEEERRVAGMTIADIRSQILNVGGEDSLPPTSARKAAHVEALEALLLSGQSEGVAKKEKGEEEGAPRSSSRRLPFVVPLPEPAVSAEEAAREKAAAGEHRGVEHVAELSRDQAVEATAAATAVVTPPPEEHGEAGSAERISEEKETDDAAAKPSSGSGRRKRRKSKRKRKLGFE